MSGWESIADRKNFLVIYPHGSSFPLRWNTSPGFKIEQIDDVQFILDLLDDLGEIVSVDEDRIYVSGFSNGAAMTDLVACSLADRIAAVGLVQGKGENAPQDCTPTRPVPVIAFFGTEDPLASTEYPLWFFQLMNLSPDPAYREGVPISEWLEGWVTRNGCNPNPQTLPAIGDARGTSYMACADHAEVVIYHIEGGGHTWPGGSNLPFFGKSSTSVEASELMWDFFQHHPRADVDEPK
jgi:polyhydroxybutyrate depolymerase